MANKGATMRDVRTRAQLDLLGDRCFGSAGFGIDAAPQDIETANAVDFTIGGRFYTLAAQAAIDLSALTVKDEEGTTVAAGVTVLPDGYDRAFLICVNAAGTLFIVEGVDVAAGGTCEPPACPSGYAPLGGVKVENGSGADFTFGTTSLATAGVTDTYLNFSVVPASV